MIRTSLKWLIILFSVTFLITADLKKPANPPRGNILTPIAGHWLKTDYLEPEPIYRKPTTTAPKPYIPQPVAFTPEKTQEPVVVPRRNRELKNANIVFYWTEGNRLKVMTLLSINIQTHKACIIHFPLYTKLAEGTTLEDVYTSQGGQAVINTVAEKLEVPIEYHVSIDQKVLEVVSEIIGPVQMERENIFIAEAFAQTATGRRNDDQEVVRALLAKLVQPGTLVKVPKLVWIFTRQVETNLDAGKTLKLFGVAREMGSQNLRKTSIPGTIIIDKGKGYRQVPEKTWKNIIFEINM
ncbi:MAG: LCP family protein [Thermincolia bacterium]